MPLGTSAAIWLFALLLSSQVLASEPASNNGKELFAVCNACHDPALNPALAPPMWAVQRRYKKASEDKAQFVERLTEFAKQPNKETAIFTGPIKYFGLMPPVTLPDEQLRLIAGYIWEEDFPPPCAHWENGAAHAEASGDQKHAERARNIYSRFCTE